MFLPRFIIGSLFFAVGVNLFIIGSITTYGTTHSFRPCTVIRADVSNIRGIRDENSSLCEARLAVMADLHPFNVTLTHECKELRHSLNFDGNSIDVCVSAVRVDDVDDVDRVDEGRDVDFAFSTAGRKNAKGMRKEDDIHDEWFVGVILIAVGCTALVASAATFFMKCCCFVSGEKQEICVRDDDDVEMGKPLVKKTSETSDDFHANSFNSKKEAGNDFTSQKRATLDGNVLEVADTLRLHSVKYKMKPRTYV
jgi:hypothetical protein